MTEGDRGETFDRGAAGEAADNLTSMSMIDSTADSREAKPSNSPATDDSTEAIREKSTDMAEETMTWRFCVGRATTEAFISRAAMRSESPSVDAETTFCRMS